MRRAGPILILLIGILALFDRLPARAAPARLPERRRHLAHGRDQARSRPLGRPPRRVPGPAGRGQGARRRATWRSSRTSSSAASTRPASPSRSSRPRARTASSSSCRASPTAKRSASSSARPAASTSCPSAQTQVQEGQTLDPKQFPPLFSGDQVSSATVGTDQNGQPTVDFVLKDDGAKLVRRLHRRSTSATTSRSPSTGRSSRRRSSRTRSRTATSRSPAAGIGGFPRQGADEPRHDPEVRLAAVPDQGALERADQRDARAPSSSTRACSPACSASRWCITFMLIYYRLTGLVASFALVYYTLVVFAIFRLDPGHPDPGRRSRASCSRSAWRSTPTSSSSSG